MTKIKHILSAILILGSFSACADGNMTPAEYFEYETTDNGVIIYGFNDKGYEAEVKDLIIPSKIKGKKVITIGKKAFQNAKIDSVKIPRTVWKIEDYAFAGSDVDSVIIEEGVESIGEKVFCDCEYLREIRIPKSVRNIYAFALRAPNLSYIYLDGDEDSEPLELDGSPLRGDIEIMKTFNIGTLTYSLSDEELYIHRLEYSNPILYGFYEFPESRTEQKEYGLKYPVKIGESVTIYGERPIKTYCYICADKKNCKLHHVSTSADSVPKPNGFQVFICNKCAREKGLSE